MRVIPIGLSALLAPTLVLGQAAPIAPSSASSGVALYRVLFARHEAVPDVGASPVVKLPFECTVDGTIFVTFVDTVLEGSGIQPPTSLPTWLVAISPEGHAQMFRLGQVPGLFISTELDHYASESGVIFLVRAALENKPVQRSYRMEDGSQREYTANSAEQHQYILSFSRDGTYQRSTKIDDQFRILHLGVFSSGVFLAFGYEKRDDHLSPRMTMLKEDGSLLRDLQIPSGQAQEATSAGDDINARFTIAPAEFVPIGPQGSPQKRPMVVTSKPANGVWPGTRLFYSEAS